MSASANDPLLRPRLEGAYESISAFIAAFETLQKQMPWWGEAYEEVLDDHVPGMVPDDLQAKARDLIHDAIVAWDWELWRHCSYRCYCIPSAAELHAWINFLRRCCRELPEAVMIHRWQRPRPPRCPSPQYPAPVWFDDASPDWLLRFAAPLLRGEWQPHDPVRWLALLVELRPIKGYQHLPEREFLGLPYKVWEVMRRVPGEGRPLQPRVRNTFDLDRAFDMAIRWCEQQEKRDRKAAMQALGRRTIARPPVDETIALPLPERPLPVLITGVTPEAASQLAPQPAGEQAHSGRPITSPGTSIPDETWITAPDLARRCNLPYQALRKRLERFRKDNPGGQGWRINPDPARQECRYLYLVGAVRHIIEGMMDARPSNRPSTIG